MNVRRLSLPQSRKVTAAAAAITVPSTPAALDSAGLLKGQREILIRHGDKLYRLRHTSNDKLILTK